MLRTGTALRFGGLLWVVASLAGCRLVPQPKMLNFGKTYVGVTTSPQSAKWINEHDSQAADLVGLQIQGPYNIVNAAAFSG